MESQSARCLGLPPGLKQTVKTHIAVRCKMLDRQDHCSALGRHLVKRRRALVETNPPRNSRVRLIETVSSRRWGKQNSVSGGKPRRTIDRRCLKKLMRLAAAKRPPFAAFRTRLAAGNPAPSAIFSGCRPSR